MKFFVLFFIILFQSNFVNADKNNNSIIKLSVQQRQVSKMLDVILKSDNGDYNLIELKDMQEVNQNLYEFGLKNGKKKFFDKVKELLFTKKLINAIEQAYIEGQKDCIPGDQCQPDYSIVSCSQDYPRYSYFILKDEGDAIYITWVKNNAYKFIKVQKEWKLDGIKCGNDFFNYRSSNLATSDSDK